MKKKKLLLVILIITALSTSACWNYSEISDKRIVAGSAIDYDKENDMLELTVELVRPVMSSGQTQIEPENYTGLGDNLFNAIRNLISKTSMKIFWSHAKVIILSEDTINQKDKFLSIIDFVKRDPEPRDDIMLLVSREKTARKIYETDAEVQKIVSFHLDDMLENQESISKYRAVPLWKFVDELSGEGISPTLPTINAAEYNDKKVPQIFGTAVFKGIKKVGWLNGSETKSFLFVIDELKGGVLVVEEDEIGEKPLNITFEISNNKTKLKPVYKDENLTMKININTTANIIEVDGRLDFLNEKNLKIIEKHGEAVIKNMVHSVIKKVQKEYKSDIFGFGAVVSREMPEVWKIQKANWEDIFSKLDVDIDVKFNITGSALRSKAIKIGD